jgi:RimJ/RimL family protein N-acetyltransferase
MTSEVRLRDVEEADIEEFFVHQQDPEAARRANFPSRDHRTFVDHWTHKILANATGSRQTVTVGGAVAGNVLSWWQGDQRHLGYWLGREFWGKGVGTRAVTLFLQHETTRPLHADVDIANVASIRLLERCGFRQIGTVKEEDGEFVLLTLDP